MFGGLDICESIQGFDCISVCVFVWKKVSVSTLTKRVEDGKSLWEFSIHFIYSNILYKAPGFQKKHNY